MPTTETACLLANSVMTGCSSRQGAHQEAHTFSTHTFPIMLSGEKVLSGACSCGRLKRGAGLLIKGDGTSLGLSVSPIARNDTNTKNPSSGHRKRFMMWPRAMAGRRVDGEASGGIGDR